MIMIRVGGKVMIMIRVGGKFMIMIRIETYVIEIIILYHVIVHNIFIIDTHTDK
jgi:hypothetical protein